MSLFLSKEEIRQLTGFKQRKCQAEQLKAQGIAFWLNAFGEPIVPRSIIDGNLNKVTVDPLNWQPGLNNG